MRLNHNARFMKSSQPTDAPTWRAAELYLPTLASKTGLLDETVHFLLALNDAEPVETSQRRLVNEVLPQRSRTTRQVIAEHIVRRLIRWKPPAWVIEDWITFAQDRRPELLRAALLLHVPRQDALLYDVVQQVIFPRWQAGEREVARADVQRFLDDQLPTHPEIDSWSHATRAKVAGNALSLLRDYGLLHGKARKQIVEPVIFPELLQHLVRLLHDEGVRTEEIAHHPDWHLWLWESTRVKERLAQQGSTEEAQL